MRPSFQRVIKRYLGHPYLTRRREDTSHEAEMTSTPNPREERASPLVATTPNASSAHSNPSSTYPSPAPQQSSVDPTTFCRYHPHQKTNSRDGTLDFGLFTRLGARERAMRNATSLPAGVAGYDKADFGHELT
ncbi:MAG: hypothetical protein HY318_10655 [Armatimonadetes bacterium]|nr:hypothetical protein [Armatimonadota bacterium]